MNLAPTVQYTGRGEVHPRRLFAYQNRLIQGDSATHYTGALRTDDKVYV
jgi:hypothetical protein